MNESQEPEIRQLLQGAVPPLTEPEDRLGEVRARVRRGRLRAGAVAVGVVLVAGLAVGVPRVLLGTESSPEPAGAPQVVYQGNAMVLGTGEHGARLCSPSYFVPAIPNVSETPPCNGPANEVVGWDWGELASESAQGLSWGTYFVVGTWDGQRFTLTAPPRPADQDAVVSHMDTFNTETPCVEPARGWRPVNRALATEEAFNEVTLWAERQPAYAGAWIDQSYLDGLGQNEAEGESNDPTRFVLNLRFVGDPAQWEPRVREIWGGPLCVTSGSHTLAERTALATQIQEEFPFPATLTVGDDMVTGTLTAEVLIATPELQAEFDRRYEPDMVQLRGWLAPVG